MLTQKPGLKVIPWPSLPSYAMCNKTRYKINTFAFFNENCTLCQNYLHNVTPVNISETWLFPCTLPSTMCFFIFLLYSSCFPLHLHIICFSEQSPYRSNSARLLNNFFVYIIMFTLRIEKFLHPTFWERLQRPHSSFGGTIVKEESKIN